MSDRNCPCLTLLNPKKQTLCRAPRHAKLWVGAMVPNNGQDRLLFFPNRSPGSPIWTEGWVPQDSHSLSPAVHSSLGASLRGEEWLASVGPSDHLEV